jgi:NIPSNAP
MIFEHRTYTLQAGRVPDFVKIYQEYGEKIQLPILGNLIGVFTTEVGTLNQVIHIWGYDSFEDRTRRRAELARHPDWGKYLERATPLIQTMETKILVALPWSPIK